LGHEPLDFCDYEDIDYKVGEEKYNLALDTMIKGFEAHRELKECPYKKDDEKSRELEEAWRRGISLFIEDYDTLWW
jgi:hypothetical protein